MAPRQLIAGNWKMNGLSAQLAELEAVGRVVSEGQLAHCDLVICPPATILRAARGALPASVAVGGQDCHWEKDGAHTGDVSAAMLSDAGAGFVLAGHSERRADYGESDGTVRRKTAAAWGADLVAVVCIGETEAERDGGRTLERLGQQLAGSLPEGVTGGNTVVAYEPVWAIGTGKTATAADIAEVHAFLREALRERFGADVGESLRLLYGGSVKPSNAAELLAVANVDGALVGGASLMAQDFVAICKAAQVR